jgi:hypothetical protein
VHTASIIRVINEISQRPNSSNHAKYISILIPYHYTSITKFWYVNTQVNQIGRMSLLQTALVFVLNNFLGSLGAQITLGGNQERV